MSLPLRHVSVVLCAAGLALFAAQQRPAPKKSAAKPAAAKPAVPAKSAFDKATFEPYVRHLFVLGPQVKVDLSDPKPSTELPGFEEVRMIASAGAASMEQKFLVSKDGKRVIQGRVFDIAQNPFKPELDKLKTQFQPSYGTPGAPVVLVMFTDFECPFCKDEAKMIRQNVPTSYPKEVRVYFKDFPLQQIHPWAKPAAIAGRCIFRQNAAAFWDYHDWIYDHQSEITAENFKSKVMDFAKGKDLDVLQLTRCMDNNETESEVEKEVAEGKSLGINQTPFMFINGRPVVGRQSWPELRQIIDYEIEYQKTARNAGEDCGCDVKLPSPVVK